MIEKELAEKIQKKLDAFKQDVVFKDIQPKSLYHILWLMCQRYQPCSTIYKNTNKYQCDDYNCRSFQDIYRVSKSYIKDISYEDIYNILETLYQKNIISMHFCNVVQKRVINGITSYGTTLTLLTKKLDKLGFKNIEIKHGD